jgi:hypothetical protein
MGTNFYLRKRLSEYDKEIGIQYLNDDDYDSLRDLIPEDIHIGKRSCGWKFLFNANNFEYFDTTKESLIEWLKSGQIVDEYNQEYTFEEFWNNERPTKGWDLKEYYEQSKEDKWIYYVESNVIQKFKELFNIDVNPHGEFYIDDLRFTTFNEFS